MGFSHFMLAIVVLLVGLTGELEIIAVLTGSIFTARIVSKWLMQKDIAEKLIRLKRVPTRGVAAHCQ